MLTRRFIIAVPYDFLLSATIGIGIINVNIFRLWVLGSTIRRFSSRERRQKKPTLAVTYRVTGSFLPLKLGYDIVKRFHGKSAAMMVATQSLEDDLKARGFSNAVTWTRGVDTKLYNRRGKPALKFSWEACAKIFLSNLTPL